MTEQTKKTGKVQDNDYYNELVTVKLFKDNHNYKDDVFVAVNGVGMLVPRGKEVKIPRKYALVLESSVAQDAFTAKYTTELMQGANSTELN